MQTAGDAARGAGAAHGGKGLTSAIQRGIDTAISDAGADIVTWMDCDLSMPPEDVPKLVAAHRRGRGGCGRRVALDSGRRRRGARVHGAHVELDHQPFCHAAARFADPRLHQRLYRRTRRRVSDASVCAATTANIASTCWAGPCAQGYSRREVPYVCVPRTAGDSKTGANLWDYLVEGSKVCGDNRAAGC